MKNKTIPLYLRWMAQMEQDLFTFSEHLNQPPVFRDVHAAQASVFCVVFCRSLLSFCPFFLAIDRIGGVMVSMLVSSAVDREFEHRSGQTKNYKIGICCFSAKHAA